MYGGRTAAVAARVLRSAKAEELASLALHPRLLD